MNELESDRRSGRAVGALLLLQAVMAVPVYTEIGMMRAAIGPGFLANAAQSAILVPRALAGLGTVATLLSITAATMSLLGQRFSYLMIVPTGLTQLVLTVWLMVRGFEDRRPAARARA